MQSFIVLGYIPGTNIQTNLNFWLVVYLLVVALVFRTQIVAARRRLQAYLIARLIARTINAFEIA